MLNQNPIFLIILSLLLLFFFLFYSFFKEKFNKKTFILLCLLLLSNILCFILYNELIKKYKTYYEIYVLFNYIGFILSFILIFVRIEDETYKQGLMSNALKDINSTAYFICNQKDKIKDVSDSFLLDLGKSRKEVINKNFFDVLDKSIRLISFNDQEFTITELKEFYKKYKKQAIKYDKDSREYIFKNCNGIKVAIHFIEQPIYKFNKYKGRINVGEKKSDVVLLNVEKDLEVKNNELDLLSSKFIGLIELAEEGIFSKDPMNDSLWVSDTLKTLIKSQDNIISLKEFYKKVYQDDLNVFLEKANKESYNLRYRFLIDNNYVWLIEKGKRVSDNTYIGVIKLANYTHFEKTDILELDTIKNEYQLSNDITKLYKNNQIFELVLLEIKNIPEINKKHGRALGNMMLAEYIKKLKYNFMSENSDIYRIGGLLFGFTITDTRKMELFRKMVNNDPKSMDLSFEFGACNETITVKMGIVLSIDDGYNYDELITNAYKALNFSNNINYNSIACFYKDIK